MNYTEIVETLKEEKKLQELTNKVIAEKSGYNESSIQRILTGEMVGGNMMIDIITAMGYEFSISKQLHDSDDEILYRMNYTREKRGLTYMDIVERTGISYPTVRNCFVGRDIGYKKTKRIIEALGLEINVI